MNKAISNEMLAKALELYEEKRFEDYENLKEYTPSDSFDRRMEKLIKSQSNYYYKITLTKARKAVAVFAAAVVIIASMMSVSSIRESILGFFISRGNEVDVIEYNNENGTAYPKSLERKFTPAFIPEGYKLEDSTSDNVSRELYYVKGDNYIDFQQFVKNEYSSASDGEYSSPEKISDNGQDYIIRTSDDKMIMLVWEKNGYVFEMTGFLSRDEMFRIAKSAKADGEG